jgi:N12 class adenine-specific DNA methylase
LHTPPVHGHQRAAVARILREGRCLLAHTVGAGKTAILLVGHVVEAG